MTTWTHEELDKIGSAEELEIAPLRGKGTVRNPVTIWIVRVGNDLYVRSAYAQRSAWFRAVQVRHGGLVRAGGVEKDVIFMDADAKLNDEIDGAYRNKYRRHGASYVNMMISPEARSATIKLVPRSASS
jgi:hypothetical protein